MIFFALMRGGNRRPPQRRKLMDEKIITTYCLCDDLLHAMHHQEDPQCQMSDAEVLTTAFTAAFFFRGNFESARWMLKQHGCRSHIDVGTLRHAAPGCPVICVSRLTGHRHSGIRVFSHARSEERRVGKECR